MRPHADAWSPKRVYCVGNPSRSGEPVVSSSSALAGGKVVSRGLARSSELGVRKRRGLDFAEVSLQGFISHGGFQITCQPNKEYSR
jgi:hypothetical protein